MAHESHELTYFGIIGRASYPETYGGFFGIGAREFNAAEVRADLGALPNDGKPLTVRLLGLGGDYDEGEAMRQAFEDEATRRPVEMQVHGVGASAMSHVAAGARGTRLTMTRGAQLMFHAAQGPVYGTARLLETRAKSFRGATAAVLEVIEEKAPEFLTDERRAMLEEGEGEIWLTAREAEEAGIADGIVGAIAPEAETIIKQADFGAFDKDLGENARAAMLSGPTTTKQEGIMSQTTTSAAQASAEEEKEQRLADRVATAVATAYAKMPWASGSAATSGASAPAQAQAVPAAPAAAAPAASGGADRHVEIGVKMIVEARTATVPEADRETVKALMQAPARAAYLAALDDDAAGAAAAHKQLDALVAMANRDASANAAPQPPADDEPLTMLGAQAAQRAAGNAGNAPPQGRTCVIMTNDGMQRVKVPEADKEGVN
jgi:ATP-dependent protease ClpP protease subunit